MALRLRRSLPAFLESVFNVINAGMAHFGDVKQTVLTAFKANEYTVRHDRLDRTGVNTTNLGGKGDLFDPRNGVVNRCFVVRCDRDVALFPEAPG